MASEQPTEIASKKRMRVRRVQPPIPPHEIAPVIELLKRGETFPVIARRRERPLSYLAQCIQRRITDLEIENQNLRQMLTTEGATLPSRSILRSQPLTRAA